MAGAFHAWEDEDTTEPEEEIDVADELAALQALMADRDRADGTMLGYLEELGYSQLSEDPA